MSLFTIAAEPFAVSGDTAATAVLLIDMQRDFLLPGGFGESLGNDVSQLAPAIDGCSTLLALGRELGMTIVHTREGHLPDLSDVHPSKQARCAPGRKIGDPGPMGRILIRGEAGHDLIPELAPHPGEHLVDKSGKGAFYETGLQQLLEEAGVTTLIVGGVTTEVCVHTTVREANDRGFDCLVVADACGSYFPEFHEVGVKMISAQGGIFGCVTDVRRVCSALQERWDR